jgi:GNAT superfamily N-acetyltransferase
MVRPVSQADHDRWLPLWEGYNTFYERSGPTALPAEVTETTWARFLDPDEPVHALVAEEGERLVGLTHYLFHRSTTTLGQVCYLQDLFTDPGVRGQGVGEALIRGVYAAARAAGSTRVYWHTHQTNATAMRLYDRVATHSGFVLYRQDV